MISNIYFHQFLKIVTNYTKKTKISAKDTANYNQITNFATISAKQMNTQIKSKF